jgi:hypothetical protein
MVIIGQNVPTVYPRMPARLHVAFHTGKISLLAQTARMGKGLPEYGLPKPDNCQNKNGQLGLFLFGVAHRIHA